MKRTFIATVMAFAALGAGAAAAGGDRCNVPMAEWRSQEALQQTMSANGWKAVRIKAERGCYEASADDDRGRRVKAHSDPPTFEAARLTVKD